MAKSKTFNFKFPKMDSVLNDKNVLYIVFVVAILNLLGYLLVKNLEAVAFFLVLGFLTTYFSKNMIIVLITTIVATSVFASTRTTYVQVPSVVKEGMTNNDDSDDDDKKQMVKDKKQSASSSEPKDTEVVEESSKVEEISTISKKPRMDYAGTLEEAYKNLQKTVGEGGIEGLTSQTETLLNQQEKLMKNIQGMQPLLKTAEGFLEKFDMGNLEGITGMLGKLSGKKDE